MTSAVREVNHGPELMRHSRLASKFLRRERMRIQKLPNAAAIQAQMDKVMKEFEQVIADTFILSNFVRDKSTCKIAKDCINKKLFIFVFKLSELTEKEGKEEIESSRKVASTVVAKEKPALPNKEVLTEILQEELAVFKEKTDSYFAHREKLSKLKKYYPVVISVNEKMEEYGTHLQKALKVVSKVEQTEEDISKEVLEPLQKDLKESKKRFVNAVDSFCTIKFPEATT